MTATTQSLQAHFAPPLSANWTRRAYHASAVVGDFVYIDMGEVAVGSVPFSSGITYPQYTPYGINCTLSLPIGKSWTDPSTVQYSAIIKPQAPIYDFSSLLYDEEENSLYSFGGEESYLETKNLDLAVWKLQPNGGGGGTWTRNTSYGSLPFTQGITRPFGGASTFTKSTGFYLGGYSSSHSSPQTQNLNNFVPLPGLVECNFNDWTWSNSSAGITALSQTGSFEWGGLEYVPFGPNGLLVMWGGETSNNSIYFPGVESRPMNTVTLLDPVTKQWYIQNVTGTAPSPRNRFCSIIATDPRPLSTANSMGTSEIFMYGGYAGILGAGAEQYDEVWMLSIPAFTWLRVDGSQKSARIGHTCHLVGGRQLLSIGGADAAQTDPWSTPDYSNINGIGVFDLVTNAWKGGYNASAAPYHRSRLVQDYYDQNGAYPHSWTQPDLANLILKNATTSTTANSTTATASPSPAATSNHHGLSTGTSALIAGATIGSIIGLLIPFLLVFLYLRRKTVAHNHAAEAHGEARKYEMDSPAKRHEMAARETWKRGKQRFVVELEGGGGAFEIGSGKSPPGKGTPVLKSGRGTPAVKSGRGTPAVRSGKGTPAVRSGRGSLRGDGGQTPPPAWKSGGSSRTSGESGYWKSEYFGEKIGGSHF